MIKVKSWKIADKLFPYAVFILFLLSFLFSPYETFFLYVLSLGVIFNLYKKINYFYFLAILGISVFFIININWNYFYSIKNTLNLVASLFGLMGWYALFKDRSSDYELPLIQFRNLVVFATILAIPWLAPFLVNVDIYQLNGYFSEFLSIYSVNSYKHSMSILMTMLFILSFHMAFIRKKISVFPLFNVISLVFLLPFILSSRSIIFGIFISIVFYFIRKVKGHIVLATLAFLVLQIGVFYFSLNLEYGDLDGFRDVMYPSAAHFSLDNILGSGSFSGSEYLRSGFKSDTSLVVNDYLHVMKDMNFVGFESGFFTLLFNHGWFFGNLLFLIMFIFLETIKYDNKSSIEFAVINSMKIMFFGSFFSFHLFQPYFFGMIFLFIFMKANSILVQGKAGKPKSLKNNSGQCK